MDLWGGGEAAGQRRRRRLQKSAVLSTVERAPLY
jgi:hypothetical protein